MFSDSVYGGQFQALRAALAWRMKIARKLRPPQKMGVEFGEVNPPGYHYVKRMPSHNYRNGLRQDYDSFVGFLRIENRKHLSTRWSIEKWGAAAAESHCREWLAEKLKELRLRRAKRGTRGARRKAKRL